MNNDFNSDPKTYLKDKWEGLPVGLRFLIIVILLCLPPIGWVALLGYTIWFYHWGE